MAGRGNGWLLGLGLMCVLWPAMAAAEEPASIEATVELQQGRGHKPMVVVWLEDSQGNFVKTLRMIARHAKYFREMTVWKRASSGKETTKEFDAVVGATLSWSGKTTFKIPLTYGDKNLLDGGYMIRFEQGKEEGRHYKGFSIPIEKDFKGGIFTDPENGYVKTVTLKVPGAPDPTTPVPGVIKDTTAKPPAAGGTPAPGAANAPGR